MIIKHKAKAGSLESSDLLVIVETVESGAGRIVELNSSVALQFQESIEEEIYKVLDLFDVKDVKLIIEDKGALTPTIAARIETALLRAADEEEGTLL